MGRVVAQLRFNVTSWNSNPVERLFFEVYITDGTLGGSLLQFDVSIDGTPRTLAEGLPTLSGGHYQPTIPEVAMRVAVGGTDLNIDYYSSQVQVTENMDGTTWSLLVPYFSTEPTSFGVPSIGEFFAM